ncbi:MAG: Two-component response regulator [candidate division WWE3 bacterium GW2011_GWF2_41_45]|uniref:Response regulatory domain-containing protein n=3 Tax=Katanobacteria TaxID=422282 RepID=A0A1F4W0P1_UNCKA|nr:MAG: Two-component response regulator [candidate division WWE3 bacterium GW2011_GWC2_41_23]KKS10309.1 MAG: Two-component response regulator [candidate division WWE3 bacterium GW2011_GWF2_41_45]KKS11751.1 MAG: Two-component response regulator [candidate division WWE3 bacterium GW2011_GWF1_41_53]KKS19440.1 MAG: Two-component response regulator [candidate division WWE3 bacterium GW2011_GWE1_41_72]KKS25912.1 MAG: Two-component response regulator [candidate division WWE3 bacterium GW2011_GWC1_42_
MTKILIIEDDHEIQNLYRTAFEIEKFEVISALDGEEGLKKVHEERPSLILLDIMMPVLDGFQVLLRLKADAKTSYIPVVVLTSLADVKDAQSCLYMGAVKYLIKSESTPKQIVDIVKETLGIAETV